MKSLLRVVLLALAIVGGCAGVFASSEPVAKGIPTAPSPGGPCPF